MSDNFNVNTTQAQSYVAGGVDPNDPSQNVGSQMAANQLKQQEQAQLVAQAVEKTKQAKIGTAEAQDVFDTKGYLSEKGLMPKAQALGELKIILQKQEMDDDEVSKIIAEAQEQWPEELDGAAIWRWFSALREPKAGKMGEGQPFQAKEGELDPQGNPVHAGFYQEILDSQGDKSWVRSNEMASVQTHDPAAGDAKQWAKLQAVVSDFIKNKRGNLVTNNINRAKNALALIYRYPDYNPPSPVLNSIEADVASIMTGGAATEMSMKEAHYASMAADLNSKLGYFTGKYNVVSSTIAKLTKVPPLKEILENMRMVLTELINVSAATMKAQIEAQEPGFREIISSNPQRWEEMETLALATLDIPQNPVVSGIGAPTDNATLPGSGQQATQDGLPAVGGTFNGGKVLKVTKIQ